MPAEEIDVVDRRGNITCHLLRRMRPGTTWCGLDLADRQTQPPAGNKHCKTCWMER